MEERMNTLHHGFWTYFLLRKKEYLVKWFVIGAIAPDVIYFIMFLYMGIQKGILSPELFANLVKLPMFGFSSDMSNMALTQLHDFILEMFELPIVVILRFAGHSLVVWSIVFGLVLWRTGLKLSPLKALIWGWTGHILTDFLTHVTDATPIFWPLSDIIIRGPISYWNPDYFGREFNMINTVLTFTAIIYLVYEAIKKRMSGKRTQKGV
jgi:hypothetical protein